MLKAELTEQVSSLSEEKCDQTPLILEVQGSQVPLTSRQTQNKEAITAACEVICRQSGW